MWMLHHHMTVILKVNMKSVERDKCLCKCYIIIWLLFSKWIWLMLREMNVYVNVTSSYDCCSQSEYEKCWVRWMFMWMLHHNMTVILKVNMKNVERDKCSCKCYIIIWLLFSKYTYDKCWVRWMFMWMLHHNMTVILKLNMKSVERDECLCECYIIIWLLFSKWIWKMLSEMNVYVNVTS
jgi:hypothetical protein